MDRVISLRLDLPLQSKPRPRCTRMGRAYNPPEYSEWKAKARDHLMAYWVDMDLPTLELYELELQLHGHGRSDPDNLAGAILDAGLPDKRTGWRGCWRDDRVTCCRRLTVQWEKSAVPHWDLCIRYQQPPNH